MKHQHCQCVWNLTLYIHYFISAADHNFLHSVQDSTQN